MGGRGGCRPTCEGCSERWRVMLTGSGRGALWPLTLTGRPAEWLRSVVTGAGFSAS